MGGREDSIGLKLLRRRKDGVGTRGSGELDVELDVEVEAEDHRRMRKVGRKGLTHLQTLRQCWIGSVEQSCCGFQRRKGT